MKDFQKELQIGDRALNRSVRRTPGGLSCLSGLFEKTKKNKKEHDIPRLITVDRLDLQQLFLSLNDGLLLVPLLE